MKKAVGTGDFEIKFIVYWKLDNDSRERERESFFKVLTAN